MPLEHGVKKLLLVLVLSSVSLVACGSDPPVPKIESVDFDPGAGKTDYTLSVAHITVDGRTIACIVLDNKTLSCDWNAK
jgi:hypothetical protein